MKQQTAIKETLLTPRFYTTDFDSMANYQVNRNLLEIESILKELRGDYNRFHFIRDNEFKQSWSTMPEETKQLMVEFLERSCTAEFSGFLLYKELSRKLESKNSLLAEGFALLARDEARHAGFLNKCLGDFNVVLDLGFLTKARKYTYFSPRFILYATYLSEKIGYWRYITIYRHLQANPHYRIYPIFRYFEGWCQDENRHGDFFAAVLRAQPHLLSGPLARLWSRFFLLSVFVTMYLNDAQRTGFYEALGLNTASFDLHVMERTNYTASKIFPISLNLYNPSFIEHLERCSSYYQKLMDIEAGKVSPPSIALTPVVFANFYKTFLQCNIAWQFVRLFLLKPRHRKRTPFSARYA